MPDPRTNKSIAERFDVEFNRRSESGMRRWRRLLVWACAVLTLLLVALYEVVGDGSAYWAGPLTEPHQIKFKEATRKGQDGCAMCHTRMAQPLWRLVTGSRTACSVADERCESCHKQNPRLGHSPVMVEADILNCATCHEEHRGDKDLTAVTSGRCTSCHANLRTDNQHHTFFPQVPSFALHPEFAASRFREPALMGVIAQDEEPGRGHNVYNRVQLVEGRLIDRTPLHFNHQAHLAAHGTLLLDSTPQAGDENRDIETDANQLRWERQVCQDCHKLDSSKKYMLPIKYADHCARCHPLSYSEKLSGANLGPLSHVELAKVYVEAKARLRGYVERNSAMPDPELTGEPPRLPSKSRPAAAPAGTVDERVESLWPDLRDVVKGGCAHCHLFKPGAAPGTSEEQIVKPNIPARWLPLSKFDHDKHRSYTCVSCHEASSLDNDYAIRVGEDSEAERRLESRSTSDILMPSVAVCQKCHVAGSRPEWEVKASAECVECHAYHHKSTGK